MIRHAFAALIVAIAGMAASAYADQYAAIAYSSSTGATGWSCGYDSLDEAQTAALSKCAADDAQIAVWSVNGWCALAQCDNGSWGWGWGSSESEAEYQALAYCSQYGRGAHIIAWAFSGTEE